MDTLFEEHIASVNDFKFTCYPQHPFLGEDHVDCCRSNQDSDGFSVLPNGSPPAVEGETSLEKDHSDEVLAFIREILMEEDLASKPGMLQDCLALQATEKSLYDALNGNSSCSPKGYEIAQRSGHYFTKTTSVVSSESPAYITGFVESNWSHNQGESESLIIPSSQLQFSSPSSFQSFGSANSTSAAVCGQGDSSADDKDASSTDAQKLLPYNSTKHKKRLREDRKAAEEYGNSKQSALDVGGSESLEKEKEMYHEISLCSFVHHPKVQKMQFKRSTRGRPRSQKKPDVTKEVVDLRSLLLQCAQAVANHDRRTANDLLVQIRQHSSATGDGTERQANYFADALEARLAGTGTSLYMALASSRISAAQILKCLLTYIKACPFMKMSNIFANKAIKKLAAKARRLHIIDFGILYGYQWPCLIRGISEKLGGPPKLRITGIDFPQPGASPAGRVEETGHRLAKYSKRFNVPFEYTAIAKKWETIQLEDLNIDKNDLVVVNCLYRMRNVPDETVMVNSPRDDVLDLIKRINPELFIHGVVNGTYNTPFFVTRFREALFHFSSMFDIFESTLPRDDQERLQFEKEVLAKEAVSIIACEGAERIDRPETYKQWQVRNCRAGLRQLPLDQDIIRYVRNKVKLHYHKDFSVDEDKNWVLQGWKGRVVHALSYWKPAKNKS